MEANAPQVPWITSGSTVRCIVRDAVGKFCWDAQLLYGPLRAGQCCYGDGPARAQQMHQLLVARDIHALANSWHAKELENAWGAGDRGSKGAERPSERAGSQEERAGIQENPNVAGDGSGKGSDKPARDDKRTAEGDGDLGELAVGEEQEQDTDSGNESPKCNASELVQPMLPDPKDYIDKDFETVRDPLDQVLFIFHLLAHKMINSLAKWIAIHPFLILQADFLIIFLFLFKEKEKDICFTSLWL